MYGIQKWECLLRAELQERIAKASSSTKDGEMHAKVKQDKLGRIKSLKQQIATVQSETSKLKEAERETKTCKSPLCKPCIGEGGVRKVQDVLGENYSARMERGAARAPASKQKNKLLGHN